MTRRPSSVLRFSAQHGNPESARVLLPGLVVIVLVGLVARFVPWALAAAAGLALAVGVAQWWVRWRRERREDAADHAAALAAAGARSVRTRSATESRVSVWRARPDRRAS
ncbi:hypothetical protein ACVGVM_20750 [Pseudonocardia bannensis]|uniref:Uncharacterized protein n=1 Tax=Pseudonocardia bannensis TaxID=630973 RepID=A0A848DRU9_9PSEU|nr:hypothetical protein [Pseudonocardia bannensis]NMH95597.1 hypothetical protein [Pseudonocardia bannensis]